jgi:hypothetical protein
MWGQQKTPTSSLTIIRIFNTLICKENITQKLLPAFFANTDTEMDNRISILFLNGIKRSLIFCRQRNYKIIQNRQIF